MKKEKPNYTDCIDCENWDESFGCLRGCKYYLGEDCIFAEKES
jgi:hypothetical protein